MKIEVLYVPDCPHYGEAVRAAREALAAEGLKAKISEVEVCDQAQAEALRFLGSPTIRVNGVDVEPIPGPGYGLACRAGGCPSSESIRQALHQPHGERASMAVAGAAAAGAGAALTAAVAGACCLSPAVAPLIVAALGASGAASLAGFEPHTPYLLAGSLLLLAFSFRRVYRCGARRGVRVLLWFAALVWMLAFAAAVSASDVKFAELDSSADPLRAAFNSDTGKTRILMLVSPT